MVATAHFLASGSGWRVDDVICTSGPLDQPFEEQYDGICIAAVTPGSFQYRSTQSAALLIPGALLLGDKGRCFECGHDHGIGDRCLSFHFTPEFFQTLAESVPGTRWIAFTTPNLPPLPALIPTIAAGEAARDDGDTTELAETRDSPSRRGRGCADQGEAASTDKPARRTAHLRRAAADQERG